MPQNLLKLLIISIVVGGVLFIFNRLPLDATIKLVVNVVATVILAIVAIKFLWALAF